MKWFEKTKEYSRLKLYFFNRVILLGISTKGGRHRWHELTIKLGKFRAMTFEVFGRFGFLFPFDCGFCLKRTRFEISLTLLSITFRFRIGHIDSNDNYDAHLDKYYDQELTKPVVFSEPKEKIYKEYFSSKWLKIYNEDWLNCPYRRTIDFTLPFQHHLKIDFQKPFVLWEWLGFNIDFKGLLNFSIDLMLFKHNLSITLGKSIDLFGKLFSSSDAQEKFLKHKQGDLR